MHAARPAPQVRLRPTMGSNLDFVLSVEQDASNRPFITPWDRTQHEGAIRFPDLRHFIVEAGAAYPSVGFVILQGCRNLHRSIELRRIVLHPAAQGAGVGRAGIRLFAQMAFCDLGAHRFRLEVNARNLRAQALYRSEGGRAAARERSHRRRRRLARRDSDARTRTRTTPHGVGDPQCRRR